MLIKRYPNSTRHEPIDIRINHWLDSRDALLTQYASLNRLPPFDESSTEDPLLLQEFCQLLIDYVCQGHFEIYELLAQSCAASNPNFHGLPQGCLDALTTLSEQVLLFNDKADLGIQVHALKKDLRRLGEGLAHRLDLEDRLIQLYLNCTSTPKQTRRHTLRP